MTDKELQEVRKKTLYKNDLKELKNQILKLEQDPKVKEYISLNQEFETKSKNDIPITISREQSNKLLFGYGRFSMKINGLNLSVFIYRDLETKEYFYHTSYFTYKKINYFSVCNSDKEEFENKNCEFEKTREYFFEQLLNKPQEQVVWEMFENNKQLIKGRKHELLF